MIPSYFKNEILTIREQMVPLGSNGLRYCLLIQIITTKAQLFAILVVPVTN